MSVLSSLLVAVGVDPAGVDRGLGQADSRIGKFANGLNRTGATLTKGLTLPIVALGGFALKSAMDVDEAYDTIQSGTGATGRELKRLEGSFASVAKRTPADLGSVADTVTKLNQRLGLSGSTLQTLSMQILEAGRMGGVPVDIKNATAAFSVFDLKGRETTFGMDDLFRVSQSTGVGINDLTSIMAKSGGVLSQLGFGFTESASLIGTLDKAGINSRAVMSSMSAGLVKLAKDGEKPSDAFTRVTGRLQEFVKKGEDSKALKLAASIFGTRGAGQFVAALKSGKVNLDDLTGAARGSQDGILGVADKTKDFPELWQQFKNQATLALAPLAADLLPKLSDGLTKLSEKLTQAQSWWNGLSKETQGFILKALAVAAALGPTLMIFAKVITLFQTLAPIIKGLQLAWVLLNAAFAFSPIGMIVIAIVALVAGLVLAYQHSETFRNIVNGAFGAVRDFVMAAVDFIVGFVKDHFLLLVTVVTGPIGLLVVLVIKHWDEIKAKTAAAWDWVVEKVKAIPGLLVAAFMNFTLPGLIIKHWDTIKEKTSQAWGAVVDFVKSIPGKLLSFFLNWTLAGRIIQHWDEAKSGTIRVATSIVTWVAGLPGRILGGLASLAGGLYNTATDAFGRLADGARQKGADLLAYVEKIPGRIKGAFGDAKSMLLTIGGQIVQGLVNGITGAAHKVLEAAQSLIDKIPGPIRKAMGIASPSKVMLQIGRFIVAGLVKGLREDGGLASALDKINGLIEKAIANRIKNDKLAEAGTRKVIAGLKDERAAMLANERQHAKMVERLDDARSKLQDLVKTARDYAAAIRDSIVETGNITGFADDSGAVTSGDILAGLVDKLHQAQQYANGLSSLVAMGLNDTTIAQLEAAGVEGGLATVKALLAGGKSAVDSVNLLTGQLEAVGARLGDRLSDKMYGAGISAAEQLVKGLEKQVAAIDAEGRRLAQVFADALEDELGRIHVKVRIPKLSSDDVYTSAHKSAAKVAGGTASGRDAAPDRTDELLDKLDEVRAAADGTTDAVEGSPRRAQTIARKGL